MLYLSETFELMLDRWQKLYKDFYAKKEGRYDLTKVPDLYDMVVLNPYPVPFFTLTLMYCNYVYVKAYLIYVPS